MVSVPAEAVPYIGIPVIVVVTTLKFLTPVPLRNIEKRLIVF